jgi:predicted dehydrogenase
LGRLLSADIEYAEYLPDWHPYEDYRASYAARAALGGGVVLTQIHDYDLAWWLFGTPLSVTAAGGHQSELEIDVEDSVDARLEGGTVPVRVRQSFATRPAQRRVVVVGERGTLTIDLLAARVTAPDTLAVPVFANDYCRNQMFLDEVRQFAACLEGRELPAVPLDDGIAVLKLALAVKEAIRTGREVPLR